MTGIAPRSPTNDEALDILRRVEPILARIEGEQRRQADIQRKQGEDIAEIRGRLSATASKEDIAEVKGQLKHMPTMFQIVPGMLGINAAIIAMGGIVIAIYRALFRQ